MRVAAGKARRNQGRQAAWEKAAAAQVQTEELGDLRLRLAEIDAHPTARDPDSEHSPEFEDEAEARVRGARAPILETMADEDEASGDEVGPGVGGDLVVTGADVAPPMPCVFRVLATFLPRGERENWLGELRSVRWELRSDPRARRVETRTHACHLLGVVWSSWRHGSGGDVQAGTS